MDFLALDFNACDSATLRKSCCCCRICFCCISCCRSCCLSRCCSSEMGVSGVMGENLGRETVYLLRLGVEGRSAKAALSLAPPFIPASIPSLSPVNPLS